MERAIRDCQAAFAWVDNNCPQDFCGRHAATSLPIGREKYRIGEAKNNTIIEEGGSLRKLGQIKELDRYF
jgi:hypothetical protein